MATTQTVNLVLKTSQIEPDNAGIIYFNEVIDTMTGTVASNRTSITWKNINLKTLLGDMFEKYERFNICLNFVSGSETGSLTEITADNRLFQIKLSGLPFTSSYNQNTATNNGTVVLSVVQVPLAANSTWLFNAVNQPFFTFLKQDFVNISIDLHTVETDTYYTIDDLSLQVGHMIFSFNIYGVDSFENKDITFRRFDLHPIN